MACYKGSFIPLSIRLMCGLLFIVEVLLIIFSTPSEHKKNYEILFWVCFLYNFYFVNNC
jgi:hypothetical protein